MEVSGNDFSMYYIALGFCIILSHRWFTVGRYCLLESVILNVKDKGFCSFLCIAVSALITEITVGLKLRDGIKWASFLCFQSSIWEVLVGAGHTRSLFLSLHWGCECLLPLSVRVSSRVSLTKIDVYCALHGRFGLRTKTDVHVDRLSMCCFKDLSVNVWP